ncbi:Uncharacterized protein HZ326_16953, partial [Fusarium oxysporum f. sp. albedinis]
MYYSMHQYSQQSLILNHGYPHCLSSMTFVPSTKLIMLTLHLNLQQRLM